MEYELLDHTGDMAFRVAGPDRPSVFERAGRAMFDLIVGLDSVRPDRTREIEITEAVDPEDLLVRFLSELLYLHDAEDWLFREVRVSELHDDRLRAVASGERFDPARHRILRQVKAVTYHALRLECRRGTWEARIVLDL